MADEIARQLAAASLLSSPNAVEADDRIVIALDFGTTFSGIAYAFCNPGKKAELKSILDWPGTLQCPWLLVDMACSFVARLILRGRVGRTPAAEGPNNNFI